MLLIFYLKQNSLPFPHFHTYSCQNILIEPIIMTNNLQRFVVAHEGGSRWSDASYEDALEEVRNGRKVSHWIWYIFPQMKGQGYSAASEYYGIANREEAKAYIEHSVLGPHLVEISQAYLATGKEAYRVFGDDAIKVRSCMLLFASVSDNPVFKEVCKRNSWLI